MNAVKRTAKNSIIMYVRMAILMLIAFYTSRLLLLNLGTSDFGVYSVVGSISTAFIAIKSLFSESIQRFLNVTKGKAGDTINEQIVIFNMSIIVHLILILVFAVLVESIGGWFVSNKLNFPQGRLDTAVFVFHMTVLSTCISIMSIPFDALIIANEKMGVFAMISIIDAILKLVFVVLLPFIAWDMLKAYSLFMVFIPIATLLMQFIYSRKFQECRYNLLFDKRLFRSILNLSSWNFFGNICFSLIHEGINMLLNIFGGVTLNAARAISYQVKNATAQLSSNTMVAVRPIVMKSSVQKDSKEFFDIIITLSRLSFFAIMFMVVPLEVYSPYLIELWLGSIPDYSVLFTRILLLGTAIRSLHEPLNIMYMSYGSIKRMMIIEASVMLSFLLLICVVVEASSLLWSPFALLVVMEIIIIFLLTINAKSEFHMEVLCYWKSVILTIIKYMACSSLTVFIFTNYFKPESLLELVIYVILVIIVMASVTYSLLSIKERNLIKKIINL